MTGANLKLPFKFGNNSLVITSEKLAKDGLVFLRQLSKQSPVLSMCFMHNRVTVVYTEWCKNRKCSTGRNALLLREIKGEWAKRFTLTGRHCQEKNEQEQAFVCHINKQTNKKVITAGAYYGREQEKPPQSEAAKHHTPWVRAYHLQTLCAQLLRAEKETLPPKHQPATHFCPTAPAKHSKLSFGGSQGG